MWENVYIIHFGVCACELMDCVMDVQASLSLISECTACVHELISVSVFVVHMRG